MAIKQKSEPYPQAINAHRPIAVKWDDSMLWVRLEDGRVIGTPLEWYITLSNASRHELNNYQLMDDGIHWPDLDEDLSIEGMLNGRKPHYPQNVDQWRARLQAMKEVKNQYGEDAEIWFPFDMTDPQDAIVTVKEIAEEFSLSTDAVYQAIRRGNLPAERSGGTWLIRRRDADILWARRRQDNIKVAHP